MSSSDRKCAVCAGELPADARADAVYCSAKCRQQALRDRSQSDAVVIVGGTRGAALAFEASFASHLPGVASVSCRLRGDPAQRDATGRVAVELRVSDEPVWSGHLERLKRSDSGATTITAATPDAPSDCTRVERVLAVRDLAVTTFGTAASAPVAIVVRSQRGEEGRYVGAGELGAVYRIPTRRPHAPEVLDTVAARIAETIAAGIVHIEATCDDNASTAPGDRVRIDHEAVRDLVLTISRVVHVFADGVLTTRFEALHVPAPPTAPDVIGMPTAIIGPLSVLPARAVSGGGIAA